MLPPIMKSRMPIQPNSAETPVLRATGRILALDLGKRRIGLAISDPLGITAQGLPTLERRNKRTDLAILGALVR